MAELVECEGCDKEVDPSAEGVVPFTDPWGRVHGFFHSQDCEDEASERYWLNAYEPE